MSVYSIVFSPTGGTQRVAALLTSGLGSEVEQVDLTDARRDFRTVCLGEGDVAVISVPSYGGRVPSVAAERLGAISGGGARAVLVCAYGNRAYEDTLLELGDVATRAGFRVIAGVAAVAEHSIVRRIAAGRPDAQDADVLSSFAGQIREKLSEGTLSEPSLPGNRPYRKAGGAGMVPKPTRDCTRCAACAASCPVQAIDEGDSGLVDEKACISCMRCVDVCPQGARKVSPVMLSAASLMLKKACSARNECELFL